MVKILAIGGLMSRILPKLLFLSAISACSLLVLANAQDATTATVVNPVTQETTTATVNPDTQQTTITQTNPTTQTTTTTIVTPVPAPKVVMQPPQGFVSCFTIAAGWFNNVWIPAHDVCQYDTSKGTFAGSTWVTGHWRCMQYKATEGVCTDWRWSEGRWVSCDIL